jgi:hypothetical protein
MVEIMNSWYVLIMFVAMAIAFGWAAYLAVNKADELRLEQSKHGITKYYYQKCKAKLRGNHEFISSMDYLEAGGFLRVAEVYSGKDGFDTAYIGPKEWSDDKIEDIGIALQWRSGDDDTLNVLVFDTLSDITAKYMNGHVYGPVTVRQKVDDWEIDGKPLDD